jgi:hypothetical protein
MTHPIRDNCPREVEELTTAIQRMASRFGANFVLDTEKARNFQQASERRDEKDKPSREQT